MKRKNRLVKEIIKLKERKKAVKIKQNADRTYCFDTIITLDNGVKKHVKRSGYKTKIELKDDYYKICRELNNPAEKEKKKSDMLFSNLCSNFLESIRCTVKATSFDKRRYDIMSISKMFGDTALCSEIFDIEKIGKFKNEVFNMDITLQSKKTKITLMKKIISRAVSLGLLTKEKENILVDDLKIIKENGLITDIKMKKEKRVWTVNQFNDFYKTFEEYEPQYKCMIRFLFYTGVRKSEMFGLKPSDFDFDNKAVSIRIQRVYVGGKGRVETTLKSALSLRTIKLDDTTSKMCEERAKEIDGEYMFDISPTELDRVFARHSSLIGFYPPINAHEFRHSHDTFLIHQYLQKNQAIDFVAIAKRMGHSTDETIKTYAHIYGDVSSSLSNIIGDIK